ncbi:MAG: stage 0 sporulation protein [Candidatus Krumholzibacteriota bacterium]|nr:stage 0 sporulation protein [Candidatus Krumholzibacteriota bacterium]
MIELVEVGRRGDRREFLRNPLDLKLGPGDWCILDEADPARPLRIEACVALADEERPRVARLRAVARVAGSRDLALRDKLDDMERHAYKIGRDQIAFRELPMKLVDVECEADGGRVTFFFTAENRVDFRELVKDLAAVFRTRIELRQIGVRDAAQRLPGLAVCGQQVCCARHLRGFEPITLRMAKDQELPLTPGKLSGLCGRLKCCLTYELDFYQDLARRAPRLGGRVQTPGGPGRVVRVDGFREEVEIQLDAGDRLRVPLDEIDRPVFGPSRLRPGGGSGDSGGRRP